MSYVWFRSCVVCRLLFTSRSPRRQTCSDECAAEKNRRRYRAYYQDNREAELLRHTERRAQAPLEERLRNRARNQQRRAIVHGADAEEFSPLEIYERDGWVCGICHHPIDPDLRFPDPGSASLDHVVPLSRGGQHTRANSRASHLHCNCARGNRAEHLTSPDMGTCPDKGGTDDGRQRTSTQGSITPSRALAL